MQRYEVLAVHHDTIIKTQANRRRPAKNTKLT